MSARETLITKTNGIRKAVLPGFDGAPLELVAKPIARDSSAAECW
ncbi:MAG: hypothetical protein R2758_06830 [Bacteroidales bacterium]